MRWITTEALEELHWSEMDTAEFVEVLKKGTLRLFDIREPAELEESGSIPGSVNLPCTLSGDVLYDYAILCVNC